jgi:hypothetical protein
MYLGTTPTITLKINTDFDFKDVKQIWFTISSMSKKITKTIDDVILDNDNKTMSITLTQEETFYFSAGIIEVQARILTINGEALATPIKTTSFERVLEGGVISE